MLLIGTNDNLTRLFSRNSTPAFNRVLDKYSITALNVLHFTALLKVALPANITRFSKLHSCGPQTQPHTNAGDGGDRKGGWGSV